MAGRAVEGVGAGTLEEGSRALVLHDLAGCICRRRRTAPGRQEAQQQMMGRPGHDEDAYCTAVEIQVNCLKTYWMMFLFAGPAALLLCVVYWCWLSALRVFALFLVLPTALQQGHHQNASCRD